MKKKTNKEEMNLLKCMRRRKKQKKKTDEEEMNLRNIYLYNVYSVMQWYGGVDSPSTDKWKCE